MLPIDYARQIAELEAQRDREWRKGLQMAAWLAVVLGCAAVSLMLHYWGD